jgi:histidinol-phosphate aminotransferase
MCKSGIIYSLSAWIIAKPSSILFFSFFTSISSSIGISDNTMKKLVRENILKIEQYEPGKPIELLRRELGIEGEVCKMASNENPLGPSPLAVAAIIEALKEGNFYPDNSCYEIREKLGQNLNFPIENIRMGNGSSELIYMTGIAFLNRDENVVMSEDTFLMAPLMCQIIDCQAVVVPLNDYHHDLDRILDAINDKTKIVYLDIPMNPIGTSIKADEFARFMGRIPEDVLVICDEAYFDYAEKANFPHTIQYVRDGRNVMVLRTFSKLYGLAGFRIGYCIAKKDIVEALRRVSLPFSVNKFAQIGALAALDDRDHVRNTLAITAEGKKYLCAQFDEMSVSYIPAETNFITLDVRRDARELCSEFQKRGVIVRPLAGYGKPTFIRITIGTKEQNKKFIEVFKELYQ